MDPSPSGNLIVAIDDTDSALTIAMADPDNELVESIARVKNKKIIVVVAPKTEILGIIVEFLRGFRRSSASRRGGLRPGFPGPNLRANGWNGGRRQ